MRPGSGYAAHHVARADSVNSAPTKGSMQFSSIRGGVQSDLERRGKMVEAGWTKEPNHTVRSVEALGRTRRRASEKQEHVCKIR